MTPAQTQAWVTGLFVEAFSIRQRPPSLQWCRENISLPSEVSPTHPGRFNPDVTPLTTIVYDWFDDPQWRELWVVKASQGGLSQAAQNLTCYNAEFQLGDEMWVLESAEKAKQLNVERIKPMITQACPSIARFIFEDADKLQNRALFLKGLKILMAGARAAGGVASRTLRFIKGDEIDEWLNELQGGESNAADLLRERCKLVEDAKLLFFSKPRNAIAPELLEKDARLRNRKKKDDGIIWQEYLTGTRHRCFVPCKRCGHFQEMVWDQVKYGHCRNAAQTGWDYEKVLAETYYECSDCKERWTEEDKVTAILQHRQWRPTNEGRDEYVPVPRKMSAHMSDLYVNSREFPTLTLGHLAVKCCSAMNASAKRAFRRGTLGLPVEQKVVERSNVIAMRRLCGEYTRGQCPSLDIVAACTQIDVQEHGNLFKWVKMAFTMEDEVFIVDNGVTEFDEEITVVFDRPVTMLTPAGEASDLVIRGNMGWIDEGEGVSQSQVLDLCLHKQLIGRLSSSKGRGGSQTESMPDRVALQKNRTHKGRPVDRYLVDSDYFLDQLYEERITPWSDHLRKLAEGRPSEQPAGARVHFFKDAEEDFLLEFTTERKDWHLRKGILVFGWPPKPERGGKNDYSDCVKNGIAWWYRTKILILKQRAKEAALAAATPDASADKPPSPVLHDDA